MKVLIIIPPYAPSYMNAGHHLPVFECAAWLRKNEDCEVDAFDFGALNGTWADVCRILVRGKYDVACVFNDFDAVDGFARFLHYIEELTPTTRTITFGRASKAVPRFFFKFGFDAVAQAGDYELSLAGFVRHVARGEAPSGVMLRDASGDYAEHPSRGFLPADMWEMPDLSDIPYRDYERVYGEDLNKFCGIPKRREFVLSVARGCPVGCAYCDVPIQQGLAERRISVDRAMESIETALRFRNFDYVSMYAPTFTLKRGWVEELCARMVQRFDGSLKWKCVTTLAHLSEPLLQKMARSGCVRISIGLETLDAASLRVLPKLKQFAIGKLDEVSRLCDALGIELNCFLMIGFPGEEIEETRRAFENLIARGHRIRPTVYTQFENVDDDASAAEFGKYNRQLFNAAHDYLDRAEREQAYDLLYANSADRVTEIMKSIPVQDMLKAQSLTA